MDAETGKPVPGAELMLQTTNDYWWPIFSGRSDTEGRAVFGHLPLCDVFVSADASSYEQYESEHIVMPANEEIVLRLKPKP